MLTESTLPPVYMPAPPAQPDEQRMAALRKANEIRSARARIKHQISCGEVKLSDLIVQSPAILATARVYEFVLIVPRVGRVKAQRIMRFTRTSHGKTIGGLTSRQRIELATALKIWEGRG